VKMEGAGDKLLAEKVFNTLNEILNRLQRQ
jgi:hypothetical protein